MELITARAPGRVELLGNHVDYNEGCVLSAATPLGTTVAGVLTDAPEIALTSDFAPAPVRVALDFTAPGQGEAAWGNYLLGAVRYLFGGRPPPRGFRLHVSGDLPAGAGLSSSAALEVATATWLTKAFGLRIEPLALARLCRRAENEFVGVQCGLLDQASSVFGRRGQVVYLDCRSEQVTNVPLPPGLELLVFHTGAAHRLVGGEYNERRARCFAAAAALGARTLREVTPARLEQARGLLDPVTWRRAAHVVGEMARVDAGVDRLRRGDGPGFGQLMYDSHESSRVNFENSTPELDTLVELARGLPGVLGARLSGGGFGGAIVCLLEEARAGEAAAVLGRQYHERTGFTGQAYLCPPADGAR